MRIPRRRRHLRVPEQLADHRQALARGQRGGGQRARHRAAGGRAQESRLGHAFQLAAATFQGVAFASRYPLSAGGLDKKPTSSCTVLGKLLNILSSLSSL